MKVSSNLIFKEVKRIISSPPIIFLFPFILPLLMIFLANPESFILGWNEGQGGLSFVLLFLLIEWFESGNRLKFSKSTRKLIWKSICLIGILFYFSFLYLFGFHTLLKSAGELLGVEGLLSWTRLWDYIAYTLFIIGIIHFSFDNVKALKYFPTPIVYTMGMVFILLLDSLLPHSQLGIFEGVVSVIFILVVSLLNLIGVQIHVLSNYTLLVNGQKGTLRVAMYWPCVGILSMLIYLLVIVILMIKMNIPFYRKVIYATIGAIGTFFINVIRIFLIIYYGAYVSVNLRFFHETIGEVIFIVWIVLFILIVTEIESRKKRISDKKFQKGLIEPKSLTKQKEAIP